MKKFIIAVAAAVFALSSTLIAPPAHAGMKGRLAIGLAIGAIGVMAHQHRYEQRRLKKKRYHARRKSTKKVYVAKKPSASVKKIAKAKPEPQIAEVAEIAEPAENENSSISTAALAPIDETASIETPEADASEPVAAATEDAGAEPAEVQKSASKLDCKKFFPAVGMTLSVSCE
jgi:hypothetical protein